MIVVETSAFTRRVQTLLTDDEYRELQLFLTSHPEAGAIIQNSGGLRKLRWAAHGPGKRGGVRTIYYFATPHSRLLMLTIYAKNERDDLSKAQLKILRRLVEEEYP